MKHRYYFFPRNACGDAPAGVTVSKKKSLPRGDFNISGWTWKGRGHCIALWFVDDDNFTEDEREIAKKKYMRLVIGCEVTEDSCESAAQRAHETVHAGVVGENAHAFA